MLTQGNVEQLLALIEFITDKDKFKEHLETVDKQFKEMSEKASIYRDTLALQKAQDELNIKIAQQSSNEDAEKLKIKEWKKALRAKENELDEDRRKLFDEIAVARNDLRDEHVAVAASRKEVERKMAETEDTLKDAQQLRDAADEARHEAEERLEKVKEYMDKLGLTVTPVHDAS